VWASPFDASDLESGKEDITGVSSIAVANIGGSDLLYFGCDNGYLYCVNASTKTQVWSYRPDVYGCIESSPMIYAGNVYYGITYYMGVNLYAVNASTGEQVWATRLTPPGVPNQGEEVRATCAAMDNAIYVGEDTGHYFYRVNAQTGQIEPYQYPPNPFDVGSDNYFVGSAAFLPAGYGVVGNDNGMLYALDKDDVTLLADYNTASVKYRTNGYVCSSPAISYAVDAQHNRWMFVTSRGDNNRGDGKGTILAFKQIR